MKHCDNIDKDEENIPLVIDTDASDTGIDAALGQASSPVAFFSQSLTPTEWKYTSVENKASAIIKAVKRWCHYLSGQHITTVMWSTSKITFSACYGTHIANKQILIFWCCGSHSW